MIESNKLVRLLSNGIRIILVSMTPLVIITSPIILKVNNCNNSTQQAVWICNLFRTENELILIAVSTYYLYLETSREIKETLRQNEELLNRLDENAKLKVFKYSDIAYSELRKTILNLLQSKKQQVNIDVIAVSMTYSCRFIETLILNEFCNYTNPIKIRILLVNPNLLNKPEWKKYKEIALSSIERMNEVEKSSNVSIEVWVYDNIPQFHGLFINDCYLFLGEVGFDFITPSEVKVYLGDRGYRMLSNGEHQGKIFKNWFNYYKYIGDKRVDR